MTEKQSPKSKKLDRMLTAAIVFLSVVAMGLGYLIIADKTINLPFRNLDLTQFISRLKSSSESSPLPLASSDFDTATISAVLNFPSPDAAEAEHSAFNEIVSQYAQQTAVLDIAKCEPAPIVMKVKQNSPFTVKNSDTVDRSIGFANKADVTVAANDEVRLSSPAEIGAESLGNHGYRCDGIAPKGVLQVVPE